MSEQRPQDTPYPTETKLVPCEPTEEMLDAVESLLRDRDDLLTQDEKTDDERRDSARDIIAELLAASPTIPVRHETAGAVEPVAWFTEWQFNRPTTYEVKHPGGGSSLTGDAAEAKNRRERLSEMERVDWFRQTPLVPASALASLSVERDYLAHLAAEYSGRIAQGEARIASLSAENARMTEALSGIVAVTNAALKHRGKIGKETLFLSAVAERAGGALEGIVFAHPDVARLTRERDEARASEEAMDEKVRALAPHGSCACSYDRPGDVCSHHSPKLAAAEARLATAAEERKQLALAVVANVITQIVDYAEVIASQAGVGESETAGQIVSYLADRPGEHAAFMAGNLSVFGTDVLDHHAGRLTWHGSDGKVYAPDPSKAGRFRDPALREKEAGR